MYSTDNGAEVMSWPDGGTTPFRGEKDTNFEGGWRVPCAIRWPGVIKPGTVSNEIFSHTDMLPTLAAAAGEPDIVEKLKKGYKSGNKTFKVHIDGYNLLPFLKGEVKENPRKGFLYWSDDGDLMALRVGNWKVTFMEQRAHGFGVWQEPLVALRVPKIFNLRSDPVRAGDGGRVDVLRQVDGRPRVPARAGAGDRRRVPQDLRGVPAAAEAGQLQHRPGAREGAAEPGGHGHERRGRREVALVPEWRRLPEERPPPPRAHAAGCRPDAIRDDPGSDRASSTPAIPIRRRSKISIARATSGGTRTAIARNTTCSGHGKPYRADLDILVAGCGTWQAAKYAVCRPDARVVGIDVSTTSLEHTGQLKRKYNLTNLETAATRRSRAPRRSGAASI